MNRITSPTGVLSSSDPEQRLHENRVELELARLTLNDYQSSASSSSTDESVLRDRVADLSVQVIGLEQELSDRMHRSEQAALARFQSEEQAACCEPSRDEMVSALWQRLPNDVVKHELLPFGSLEDLAALSAVSARGPARVFRQYLLEMTQELLQLGIQHPLIQQSITVMRSAAKRKLEVGGADLLLFQGENLLLFQADFAQRLGCTHERLVAALYEQIQSGAAGPTTAQGRRALDLLKGALVKRLSKANLFRLPDPLRADREIVLARVRQSGFSLREPALFLQKDPEIVLAAVRQYGSALLFADPSLRADRKIVLAAVQQHGIALMDAHPSLQADREIVLAAVRQHGMALAYAHPSLQADREIVLAAVQQNGNGEALKYAHLALQNDPELVQIAQNNLHNSRSARKKRLPPLPL